VTSTVDQQRAGTSLIELRRYQIAPGRRPDFDDRFANVTTKIFERLGFRQLGQWAEVGRQESFFYALSWPDQEAMELGWSQFGQQPDWIAAREASEQNAPLVLSVERTLLAPTPRFEAKHCR
jgi:heme-degrading monooxygenase HmoA